MPAYAAAVAAQDHCLALELQIARLLCAGADPGCEQIASVRAEQRSAAAEYDRLFRAAFGRPSIFASLYLDRNALSPQEK